MNPDFRRFAGRFVRFLAPLALMLVVWEAAELFVLPINAFTFRPWEALVVVGGTDHFPGPFYPNRTLEATETGDLGHDTSRAVPKHTVWRTDDYGFRNTPDSPPPYDIVVVGDSFTVGTSLTQGDTLPVQLSQLTGRAVYGYAPRELNVFLADNRFLTRSPRVVVLAMFERSVPCLPSPAKIPPSTLEGTKRWAQGSPTLKCLWVLEDRLLKQPFLNRLRSRSVKSANPNGAILTGPWLFYTEDLNPGELPVALAAQVAERLLGYRDWLAQRGIQFIFMPIPKKESVYWKWRPDGRKPRVLAQVMEAAARAGIRTVDLPAAFDRAALDPKVTLYQTDDTHWSPEGVRIAADLLCGEIKHLK